MTSEKFLAALMIALEVVTAIPYGIRGDWRRSAYWLLAAAITAVVTY